MVAARYFEGRAPVALLDRLKCPQIEHRIRAQSAKRVWKKLSIEETRSLYISTNLLIVTVMLYQARQRNGTYRMRQSRVNIFILRDSI